MHSTQEQTDEEQGSQSTRHSRTLVDAAQNYKFWHEYSENWTPAEFISKAFDTCSRNQKPAT